MASAQNEKVHFGKRVGVTYGLFAAAEGRRRLPNGGRRPSTGGDAASSSARGDTTTDGLPRVAGDTA